MKNAISRIVILVLFILVALTMNAQIGNCDSFFNNHDGAYFNRAYDEGISIEGQSGGGMTQENPLPIGSGLLIMMAAGASYAVARRKNIKGFNVFIIAFAMILGMTQCKKKDVTTTGSGTIFMRITASNGSRTVFDPEYLGFNWNDNSIEYIVVSGNSTGYLGELSTSTSGEVSTTREEFSGTITAPGAGDTELHFFYLGNGSHAQAGNPASMTIDFSNQSGGTTSTVTDYLIATETIPASEVIFDDHGCHLTIDLRVKTAIAYFRLSGFTSDASLDETVYLHGDGIFSSAEINFKTGEFIGVDKGYINIGTNNVEGVLVSLIPSTAAATTLYFDSNSKSSSIEFPHGIAEKVFYSDELNSEYTPLQVIAPATLPDGVLPGLFSISPTKKVRFSKGNLKCTTTDNWATWSWGFVDEQYETVESNTIDDNFNVIGPIIDPDYSNQESIGLFGWATTGAQDILYNSNENSYMPYNTIQYTYYGYSYIPYANSYGPTGSDKKMSVENHSDWGYCIGGESSPWRTPTFDEWEWLMCIHASHHSNTEQPIPGTNCRYSSTVSGVDNARYTKAKIGGIYGLVIFPDDYSREETLKFINYWDSNTPFNDNNVNIISMQDWHEMEAAGAVFIPAAGGRWATFDDEENHWVGDIGVVWHVGDVGNYWLNQPVGSASARFFIFEGGLPTTNQAERSEGYSVRLIYDAE